MTSVECLCTDMLWCLLSSIFGVKALGFVCARKLCCANLICIAKVAKMVFSDMKVTLNCSFWESLSSSERQDKSLIRAFWPDNPLFMGYSHSSPGESLLTNTLACSLM